MTRAWQNRSGRLVILFAFLVVFSGSFSNAEDDPDPEGSGWPNKGKPTQNPANSKCCTSSGGQCCNWHPTTTCVKSGDTKYNSKDLYVTSNFSCGGGSTGKSAKIKSERAWGYCGTATQDQPCIYYGNPNASASCVYVQIWSQIGCENGGGELLCTKLRWCSNLCVDFPSKDGKECGEDTFVHEDVFYED